MLEKIIQNINEMRESKDLEAININLNSHLRDDLGLDSFDLAELTVRLEDEFGIDVFEDGIVNTIEEILGKLKIK